MLLTQLIVKGMLFLSFLWSLYSSIPGHASPVAFGYLFSVKTSLSLVYLKINFLMLKIYKKTRVIYMRTYCAMRGHIGYNSAYELQ